MSNMLRLLRQRWEQRMAAKRRRDYDYSSAIAPIHAIPAVELAERILKSKQPNTDRTDK